MLFGRADYNAMGIEGLNEKIPDDEPVFLIRASDMCAVQTVNAWACLHLGTVRALHPLDKELVEEATELVRNARTWAKVMEEWSVTKIADAPTGSI